ncbi:RE1-silencing transcription factor-like [Saccostrea echinata]|uniref:RE1-silencing transcription factor-like n=1 Tax=Saccostrea echinata TaxID=191078 RepID=UPI002A826EF4|nr:RE1-silencing transcription factor-like [Saccostrea echinata]
MVNTKTTPRKQPENCPMCTFSTSSREALFNHVLECGKKQQEKQFKCDKCPYVSLRKANLNRHKKCKHPSEKTEQNEKSVAAMARLRDELQISSDSSPNNSDVEEQNISNVIPDNSLVNYYEEPDESSARRDPVIEKEQEMQDSLILGRVVRKRTMPEIFIPAKKSKLSTGGTKTTLGSDVRRSSIPEPQVDVFVPTISAPSHEQSVNSKNKTMKDIAVQTVPTKYSRVEKTVTTKTDDGSVRVSRVVEEEIVIKL